MKISINSTFSYIKFNLNYGSALQCYALQLYLKKRGHSPSHVRDYRANPVYILKRFENIKYTKAFFQKAKAQIELQRFIKKYIALSERGYISYSGLKKRCPVADCHIAGSDQIWHNANNFRYLTYVPEEKLKLSYAASFGRVDISDEMKKTISPYLARLDGIAVREKSAVDIIESMGYEAKHVLDPTLLLDMCEYPDAPVSKSNYCYCYFLNLPDRNHVSFDQIVEFGKQMNKEVVVTAPLNYPLFLEENLIFPTTEQWLGFYKNADCIFTNTYHGLLFCIIFRKQFLFFKQKGSTEEENERFASLLTMLKLMDRVVSNVDADTIKEMMNQHIDYEKVYELIYAHRSITDSFFAKYGI